MANKDIAKGWFVTGAKPTQAQYDQLFNWLVWADEAGDLAGILEGLRAKADQSAFVAFTRGERRTYDASGSYQIPAASILEKVVVLPGSVAEISIGSSLGSDDLVPPIQMAPDGKVVVLELFSLAGREVWFNGLPFGSVLVFFTRFVKINP